MSTMTDTTNMQARVEELTSEHSTVRHFVHEDGSHSFIVHDEDPEHADPRDWDNLGIMLADGHRNYNLGDHRLEGRHSEYDDARRALHYYAERGLIRKCFPRWLAIHLRTSVVLPLGLIDHSGISMYVAGSWMSTGDASNQFDPGGWDSGLVGFIFDTAEQRERTGVEPDGVEEGLRSEVKVYDQYLTGEVYGCIHLTQGKPIVVLGDEGAYVEDYEVDEDSCWGFLGYDSLSDIAVHYTDSPITEENWT